MLDLQLIARKGSSKDNLIALAGKLHARGTRVVLELKQFAESRLCIRKES